MNDDNINADDMAEQVVNEQLDAEPEDLDRELADDVDATIDRLGTMISIDSERTMTTPFGEMTEEDLLGLVRPSLWQWVGSKRETALSAVALIHRATGDLLDKHAPDRDADELASDALDDA